VNIVATSFNTITGQTTEMS